MSGSHDPPAPLPPLQGPRLALIALAIGTLLLNSANRRVQEQRDLARRQRDLASDNFEKARQAVDIFLTSVSEEQLLNQSGLQPLRKKLLRSALDYYRDFVRQRADDPTLRRQLADALARFDFNLLNHFLLLARYERAHVHAFAVPFP